MWTPRAFRQEDLGSLHELMESYNFAVLVSASDGTLFATHLPFMIDRERGPFGTLIGHMARANPHWKHLREEVLVVFQGPHAYISPSWYRDQVTVPTWNYAVVHAYGHADLIHEPARLRPMVERLTRLHEADARYSWRLEQAEPIMESQLKGIVGFEIEITRLEGKFKLNQNRTKEDQKGVAQALSSSPDSLERELGRLMQRRTDHA